MVKISPVDHEFSLLKSLFLKTNKKKLMQAEHTARGACMPGGLNKITRMANMQA